MPAIVIIPSRYASTRFPGKPLQHIHGKPLIQHVYERVLKAKKISDVYVATDNEKIYKTVEDFNGKVLMTMESHRSGTDRIAEALLKIETSFKEYTQIDIVVNVQGDEPMIEPQMVDDVIDILQEDSRADIGTLVRRIEDFHDFRDPNVVKVVFDRENFALYFSRSPIPHYRDLSMLKKGILSQNLVRVYKHIGIYSYRRRCLLNLVKLPSSHLEEAEKLEQLRALENGYKIKVKITEYETIGVDTPEDLERVKRCLNIYL
ncbi:MAG: 3-deoxy-manno-octulosonate cytidylyltransferase [Thermodesulfovibrionales bacterium]|nr:3-deoxy-manno-octulosonate cytidylyltransferase [Thermodesulfovibrionales bacterium]